MPQLPTWCTPLCHSSSWAQAAHCIHRGEAEAELVMLVSQLLRTSNWICTMTPFPLQALFPLLEIFMLTLLFKLAPLFRNIEP